MKLNRIRSPDDQYADLYGSYGHVSSGQGMATNILQGTVPGGMKPGRQKLTG